jgi:hypothetical protein
LEEDDGLGDHIIRLAVGVDTAEDVLDKLLVGAVACRVRVIRAADTEKPSVQARRDDAGAG